MTILEICKHNGINIEDVSPIGEISDGYHTFNSLYHQRLVLFAALVSAYSDKAWKSKKHHDGELCFGGGWFIVGIDTTEGQYTYHYEDKDWDLFKCKELESAPEFDGHTDKDVTRLFNIREPLDSDRDEWLEEEIRLAMINEFGDNIDTESADYAYISAIYDSAKKAFNSLREDGHTGMSIGFTRQILNRMIDHKPLTRINDTPESWTEMDWGIRDHKSYQNKRYSSLFKDVFEDGTTIFRDTSIAVGINDKNNTSWHSRAVDDIVHELYPIVFPYYPPDTSIKLHMDEYLKDSKNGDYDTVHYKYIDNGSERIEVNRYSTEMDGEMVWITKEEFDKIVADGAILV